MLPARADALSATVQAYRRIPSDTLLTRVEHTQPAVGPFFGKFPKMPVCHAAIDELGKADNPFLVKPAVLPKQTPIRSSHGFQSLFLEQRPEKVPRQDEAVNEGFKDLALVGFSDNRRSTLPEFRIVIDFEIALEKGFWRVEPPQQLPVAALESFRSHKLRQEIAIEVVQAQASFLL